MRKIIVLSILSLDGVMQAIGTPNEDTSGGFQYGGWSLRYNDEFLGKIFDEQIGHPFDLLLGRKTYQIFAAYWPYQDQKTFSFAAAFNRARKYVVSHSNIKLDWKDSTLIQGDAAAEIKKLKAQDGPELQVYGSGHLIQTLLTHDLVDELWLKICPLTLGTGKRLFAEGTAPMAFELTESKTSPKGVITANYKRAGEVKTGSF